ncbi:MAG: CHASE3 domain-containing protein [Myxococcales bacterium]|nr:CHASE3 domain-containing protein [Myxococcales bacterium]
MARPPRLRSSTPAYVAAMVACWALALLGFVATDELASDTDGLLDSLEVEIAVEALRASMRGAAAGLHGYLLTGDEAYLEGHHEGAAAFEPALEGLVRSVSSPAQRARVDALRPVARERMNELARTLELERQSGRAAAIAHMRLGMGRGLMLEALERLREIGKADREARMVNHARVQRSRTQSTVALAAQGVLITLLLLVLLRLHRRDITATEVFREQLEARVEARTLALRTEVEARREAENELRVLSTELERSNRELNDFAFIASHDLQEPLRKIRAFADRLRTDYAEALDERGVDFLSRMHRAAERMARLIEDLLEFSRVHRHGQPFVEVDLAGVVRDVLVDLEQRIEDTGGRVEVDGELPTVLADPSQMRQLFQNLLGNALKFHREGVPPTVEIRAKSTTARGAPALRVEIRDDGIGIDEAYRNKIFAPFQRLHGRGTYEGTGIGLAICRRIVERHGGFIEVVGERDHGTTFVVTLLIEGPESAVEPPSSTPPTDDVDPRNESWDT